MGSDTWLIRIRNDWPRDLGWTQLLHGIGHTLGLEHYTDASPLDRGASQPAGFQFSGLRVGSDAAAYTIPLNPYVDLSNGALVGSLMDASIGNHWVSPGEWNAFLARGPLAIKQRAPQRAAAFEGTSIVLSGTVSRGGVAGTLEPGFRATTLTAPPPSNPTGDTCLRFFAATQQDYCFNVPFLEGVSKGYFAVTPPYPSGTQRVALVRGGNELASLQSGAAPAIAITSPPAGQTWQGRQTIRWTSNGSIFTVQYSPDDGQSWYPLSSTLTDREYTFDTADVVGGERVLFRVLATSGLDTSSATSAPVRIPQGPVTNLSISELRFTNVSVGGSDVRDVQVSNAGAERVQVRVTPPANRAFTVEQSEDLLEPGESLTLRVAFRPTASGTQQDVLRVNDKTVTLRGSAFTTAVPSIETNTVLDFGTVEIGKTKNLTLPVRNLGQSILTLNSFTVTGTGFSVVTSAPLTVAAGSSVGVTFRIAAAGNGTISGQAIIGSDDPSGGQWTVALRAQVVSGPVPASPAVGVLNAASFTGGGVAPGEIVTIFGTNVGPPTLTTLELANGLVSTQIGQTRVWFDDVAAPIVYALSGQTSVVVPYSVAGKSTVSMVVEYQGRFSDPVILPTRDAVPGLFSANSSGTGPGAILNQNNTVNTPQNPAQKGSVIVLFGTGEGATDPGVADGSVTPGVVRPILPVSVTIGGVRQTVLYAGAAPGLVAGVLQVNVQIAENTPSGNQPVTVRVGGASSQDGITVAIAGGATQPSIGVTPASLDFGTVNVNQTKDLTLSIRNSGTSSITVSSITSSNPRFAAVILNPPFNVGPGSGQIATIRFSPAAAGAQSGAITINSTDPAAPSLTVAVTGVGAAAQAPAIVLDPASLDFGSVNAGQTKDLAVTVRNNGSATLTVNSIISSNALFSAVILNTPFNVGPGSLQNVTIRFSPTSAGVQSGTLTFTSNDPATPSKTMNVTGTGAGAVASPAIVFDPASLDFGTVVVGQSKDLVVGVRNSGNASLMVSSVTSSNPRFVLLSPATPFSVGPGSFQNATIRFAPSASNRETATITFASNDSAKPSAPLPVSGTGSAGSGAASLTLTAAAGWPNGRISNQLPALAIDGNTGTYTWTTESFNAVEPSYLGVSLGAAATVNRLRIYKDNNAGGPGLVAKNLTIEYTTSDPSVPLASRTWTRVSGLTNGSNGTEMLTATAVNANGAVTADNHDSLVSSWASLSFTPVIATGIRIGFSNSMPISVNHYRVYEIQLYGTPGGSGGGASQAIAVGQTVNGTLTASSPRSKGCSTCFAATYVLTVTTSQRIDVRLNSSAFDAYLQIFDTTGNLLSSDDDSGGGTNARIAGTFGAGTYMIEVTTAVEGQTGAYILSLTALP